ncbi:hypothetical protein WDU94_003860, partial [Cyamophila willieti]
TSRFSDSAEISGYLVLKSFAVKYAASKQKKVRVLSFESSPKELNLPPDVQVHQCYRDPLGWLNGNVQSKPSGLLTALDQHIGKQDEDVVLLIDSVTHLLQHSDLCRDVNKIVNQQGSVKVKQLVMILHEDAISSHFKPRVASLVNLFKTHIDMLRDDRVSIMHKKNSGKILSEVNKIWWDKELGYLSSGPASDNSDYLVSATPTSEPLSTFNLGLSESEKLARDQLILPYVHSGRSVSGGGGGTIYVEPEDYDEEDPDDDLDV